MPEFDYLTSYQPYREIWDHQHDLFDKMVEAKRSGMEIGQEHILLLEHLPVITLGKHGHEENILNSRELERRGIECIRIERGGDITYHGPGQLVVYPILDLERHHLGVKQYVDLLEEAVIRTIADYGIKGERVEGATGVWIGKDTPMERKICAIGVKCSRFITMHGLALNVNTDLNYFSLINPCGFVGKGVTSIAKEVGHDVNIEHTKQLMERHLRELLS